MVIKHLWTDVRKNGLLAIGGDRAEQDPNPFFRACLLDAIELVSTDDEPLLEDLFAQYLIAGDYTGAGFLQNVVIAEGILAYLRFFHEHEDGGSFQQWGDRLALAVGGYFGVEYREKLRKTIRQEIRKREREVKKTSRLWADSPMVGECWSLLFVSPASSDWKGEQKYINSSGLVYAYVESEMEDGISEIMVQPQDGGLIRLG